MKYKYTKYVPGIIDELDFDQLMSKLSDFFLSSGFGNPYDPLNEDDRTMQALHDAILDALLNGGMLSDEMVNQLLSQNAENTDDEARDALEQLIEQIIERLSEQGFISMGDQSGSPRKVGPGGDGPIDPNARFEVTDKGLDFLGYRALRDLLGATGRSAAGRHDTRDLATGVDAGGAPREYQFGDTMNLDAAATILKSVQRRHKNPESGSDLLTPSDLMITQGEFQSSCATVIMLDCSHSMVLYGEDRFTPAKRVALALANMIQHQFPGDVIRAVLFHDSAEEVPIKELGRVKVGPYYTNTREGLRVARRILERQRKDMRQIIMITDGKPSAITRPDGQIYRNPNGLDPYVLRETFAEVAACRRAGIMINTFMLARDYDLVAFVRRVARICKGKAYFTTPHTLGQYVLADFLTNKTRTVH